jgi:branched-chain amino acid transport system permease protein
MSNYVLHVLIMGTLFAYLATAWNIVGGFAGQHSLGHALFVGAGAYVSTLLFIHYGISPWIGAMAGAMATGVLAFVVGFLSFRYGLRGPYFLLVTIAFAEIAKIVFINLKGIGGSSGLYVPLKGNAPWLFQFQARWIYLLVAAVLLAGALGLSHAIRNHWFGYFLLALRDNEPAARAAGVPAERLKIAALVLSAMLCALGGTFYAQYNLFIEPQSLFGIGLSLEIVLFAIVGGIGTVYGPAVGALVLYGIAEYTRGLVGLSNVGNLHLIIYAAILLVVVMFLPDGFAGIVRRLRRRSPLRPEREMQESARGVDIAARGPPGTQDGAPILLAQNITKRFGGLTALAHVDLEIRPGECFGVIGPNGSGKSTLLNVIGGQYAPDGGAVHLEDVNITGLHPESICRRGIAKTHQIAQPFGDLTARENVMVGAFVHTWRRNEALAAADSLLVQLGIFHLADTPVRQLTSANRKKIEIARALATRPKVLLLDEALAGLTEHECEEMIALLRVLKARGVTLIVVEHVMRVVVALCDRILVLDFGRTLAEGTAQDALRHPKVIAAYLGADDAVARSE